MFSVCFQVSQSHDSFLQRRHGFSADVRFDQSAKFPQRQELDEYVSSEQPAELQIKTLWDQGFLSCCHQERDAKPGFQPWLRHFLNGVLSLLMRIYLHHMALHDFLCVGSGQLQANAYCDSPDIVLVGTKADLRDTRDVHARQARDLADRYGWVIKYIPLFISYSMC